MSAGGLRLVDEGLDPTVAAFEGDQRTGVQRRTCHRSGKPKCGAGPRAVVVGWRTGLGGHLGQERRELRVAAVLLYRVGNERRDGRGTTVRHRLARSCHELVRQADGDLRGHTTRTPLGLPEPRAARAQQAIVTLPRATTFCLMTIFAFQTPLICCGPNGPFAKLKP